MWAFQQFQKKHHPDEGTVKMVVEKAGFWDAWILLLFKYLRMGKTCSLTNWFYRKHSRIHWCYFACLHFLMGSHSSGSNNSRKAGRALTLAPQPALKENGRTLHHVQYLHPCGEWGAVPPTRSVL